jgi:hypothetical protein
LRAHLLKVHPNEIGKLVNISKTIDNKLKFEFDLGKRSTRFFKLLFDCLFLRFISHPRRHK